MKKLMIVAVAGLSATLAWSAVTYTWDQSNPQTTFGDGDVTLTLDEDGKITSLTAASGGEDIVFTGDRMTFAAGAGYSGVGRDIRFENDVATEGKFSLVCRAGSRLAYDAGPVAARGTTVLFANAAGDINDYEIVEGTLCGAASGLAKPYHVKRTDTEIVAQLQQVSSTSTKFVKIRLTKPGADVLIELVCAGAVKDPGKLGADFDVEPYTPISLGSAQSSASTYGVSGLVLRWMSVDTVTFAGAFAPGGEVAVENGVEMEMVDPGEMTFATPFSGAGSLTICGVNDPFSEDKATFTVTTNDLPLAQWLGWTVLAANARLSDVTEADLAAIIHGGSYGVAVPVVATVCRFVNDGASASCQMQAKPQGGSLKGILLSFRQTGANIEMKVDGAARYISPSVDPNVKIGDDLSTDNPHSKAYDGYTANNVILTSLTLRARTGERTAVTMPAGVANTWDGGTLAIEGTDVAPVTYFAYSRTAWPRNGKVEILSGATLVMTNADAGGSGNDSIAGGTSPIYVHSGGTFIQKGMTQFDCALHKNQRIFADGGTVWFGYGSTGRGPDSDPVNTAGSTYVGYLELSNGAHCRGSAVRAGFIVPEAFFAATGDGTSYFDTGISLVGATTKDNPDNMTLFRFHADEGATLEINGDVLPFSKFTNRRMTVRKTGGGVVRFNGQINFGNVTAEYNTQPATKLQEGLIELGVSSCGNANLAFSMDGGGIATAAGTTNALGLVTLTANGAIVLGDESELALADASGATWTAGARLNVTGDLKKSRLRFGTSASALTAAQLKCVRVNGNKAKLDDDGYVCEYVPGILLIVR